MEQATKNLKWTSILVLCLAGLSLIQAVFHTIFGDFEAVVASSNFSQDVILIAKIVILTISVLILIPQVYIGIKGLKIAKKPDSTKTHITWAKILFVLSIIALISPVINMIKQGSVGENLSTFLSLFVEVIVYYDYIKYSTDVLKATKA